MTLKKIFRNRQTRAVGIALCCLFAACSEDVDISNRYVFRDQTILDYLKMHPDTYSQYVQLLHLVPMSKVSQTTVAQILSARGNYTVFAPTNGAIQTYLDSLAARHVIDEGSWDGFRDSMSLDSIRKVIVYNSIIDGGDDQKALETNAFPTGSKAEFPLANMYDRKLIVDYRKDSPGSIWVNDAKLHEKNRDIIAINGVIHCTTAVVAPTNNTLGFLLNEILAGKRRGYYVAAMLTQAVGMLDTLSKYQDDVYEDLYERGYVKDIEHTSGIGYTYGETPEHRYYGYTFFAETDDFWEAEIGKEATDITISDVLDYLRGKNIYPDATDDKNFKSEDNLLNQFVTYHFLPMRLAANRLVLHWNEKGYSSKNSIPTVVQYEYYTTMGKRRLMKFLESAESGGVKINRFPRIDNGRQGTYHETGCDPEKEGIVVNAPEAVGEFSVRNGIIYPLNQLLAYTQDVRNNLHKERIRWDITAQFPEFMNNDLRLQYYSRPRRTGIPTSIVYPYLDDCWIADDNYFFYYNGYNEGMKNYQGDELNIRGNVDVTFRLPPVPGWGIYELRFNIQSDGYNRGMVQFYWGHDRERMAAMGIPMDVRMSGLERRTTAGTYPSGVGWDYDTDDDDYNAEVDKRMRNKGFMKGAEIYCDGGQGMSVMARADPLIIRRIILREQMDPDKTYYLRFKTVLDDPTREFYVDYLEFCPKEVFDNPVTPEDIW